MGFQELATYAIVGLAAGWIVVRWWRRRATCGCGEKECPAAKEMVRNLKRAGRRNAGGVG